ncbi:hypothetical protein GUJ93_ZPchr0009g212 [Zizania palustris]|uniref:Uncharacterized protein n=1 Tax=Zizania palustris TaxID=103762 RepID=A0A8J5RND1_ZIZPA|nr:hypothetical protein GUJ93_ZPchr0009g212 [Zizania palustris]
MLRMNTSLLPPARDVWHEQSFVQFVPKLLSTRTVPGRVDIDSKKSRLGRQCFLAVFLIRRTKHPLCHPHKGNNWVLRTYLVLHLKKGRLLFLLLLRFLIMYRHMSHAFLGIRP